MFNRKPKKAEFVVRQFLFWRSDFNHPDGGTPVQRQSGEQDQDVENAINKSKCKYEMILYKIFAIVVVDFNLISEYKTENRVKLNLNLGLFFWRKYVILNLRDLP